MNIAYEKSIKKLMSLTNFENINNLERQPKLNLESADVFDMKSNDNFTKKDKNSRKIVKPSNLELKLHRSYLAHLVYKNP